MDRADERVARALLVVAAATLGAGCHDHDHHPPSSANALSAFGFGSAHNPGIHEDVVARIDGDAITAVVPDTIYIGRLVAHFASGGARVDVAGVAQDSDRTLNSFISPVTYRVTAEDGSARTYTVRVWKALQTHGGFYNFVLEAEDNPGLFSRNVHGVITDDRIAVTVPHGTPLTALVADFWIEGASVSIGSVVQAGGKTPNDFSKPIVYTVHAADGSLHDYTVTVTAAP